MAYQHGIEGVDRNANSSTSAIPHQRPETAAEGLVIRHITAQNLFIQKSTEALDNIQFMMKWVLTPLMVVGAIVIGLQIYLMW